MDRQTKLTVIGLVISSLSLFVAIVTGVPVIVDFYPNVLPNLADRLPMEMISVWSERVGLSLLGLSVGWWARGRYDTEGPEQSLAETDEEESNLTDTVNKIHGCVEKGGVAWKGTAFIDAGELSDVDVEEVPICPECQTRLTEKRREDGDVAVLTGDASASYWDCPNSDCNFAIDKSYDAHEEATNLLEAYFNRITENEEEEYSLENLIEEIDGEPTPKAIWRQYTEVVDDSDVSTSCFH